MTGPAVELLPYQKEWFADRSRFKIGMFARQTGKTFGTTHEAADDLYEHVLKGKKTKWVILSRGERQSKEAMMEGIIPHCKAYGMAAEKFTEGEFRGDNGSYKSLEVTLPHDNRVIALPANPDTARGFSANIILDEFAFHKDSRAIWKAAFPIINRGYKVRVISTPNGKSNKFYDLMTDDGGTWSRHITDIYKAVAQGYPADPEEIKRALNDEDAWRQEYLLEWLDEASAWLPWDLITSVEDEYAGIADMYTGGPCFVGNDIGRRRDLWVAWIWELVGDVLVCRDVISLKGASFREHDLMMDEIFHSYNVQRLVMDQTGMGEKPVEDAQRRYGKYTVEGVLFNTQTKQTMAQLIKERFQDRTCRIPMGDQDIRNSLHKVKKVSSPTGLPRFDADADANGHADEFWAAALGIVGATNPRQDYAAHSIRQGAPGTAQGFMRPDHSSDRNRNRIRGGNLRMKQHRGTW